MSPGTLPESDIHGEQIDLSSVRDQCLVPCGVMLGQYKLPLSSSARVAGQVCLVLDESAGKVVGVADVELARGLTEKDVDGEHEKEVGSPSWIRTNNLAVNSRPLYR
jgi:hypothetical protein